MNLYDRLEPLLEHVQKPARYIGGEYGSIIKNKAEIDVRFAFCFPDLYEIGMSHLGMKILYALTNSRENYWCERVFAPAADMERLMRQNGIPLYGLESLDPINTFDIVGFTLQYELSFTGILNMLDLAGIPLRSDQRNELFPLIIAGGPCASNPEPIADFFDLFILGEGEEVNLELIDLYLVAKKANLSKAEFLRQASQIGGIYVPTLYHPTYNDDGTLKAVTADEGAPLSVQKRIIDDIDNVFFPKDVVVPFVEVVHDRTMLEVLRGCLRGCRFCQAGFIYRPFREKSAETLEKNGRDLTKATGYEEISLTSLSTSDYSEIAPLLEKLLCWTQKEQVNLSLPSLRVDSFSDELLEQIAKVRKSGLTFAPEAGSQRLRDVVNKNITEEDILSGCKMAFMGGYTTVKLYFMLGLPTETDEDIAEIATLSQKIVELFYSLSDRPKSKSVSVTISVACFVPKPFTPFQFEGQDRMEEFARKQRYLRDCIKSKKISFKYHQSTTSALEAAIARGDRKLCAVIESAFKKGSKLDGWDEHFLSSRWKEAFEENGIDPAFYANRKREYSEIMPWDHLDYGVSKGYLIGENEKAYRQETTPNCRESCQHCGASELCTEGATRVVCFEANL